MTVIIDNALPDFCFQEPPSATERQAFLAWANDPANQTEDNLKKAGIYHPIIRRRWEELGLIVVLKNDPLNG